MMKKALAIAGLLALSLSMTGLHADAATPKKPYRASMDKIKIANPYRMTLPKTEFFPGETIELNYSIVPLLPQNAWIGIIPADVPHGSEDRNDQYDLTYQYLNGFKKGTMKFTAPTQLGRYDMRLNSTDNKGKELSYTSFTVTDRPHTPEMGTSSFSGGGQNYGTSSYGGVKPSLFLERTSFRPGEEIVVSYTASPSWPRNAWIGIIPSNVAHGDETENDKYDVSYQYIEGRTQGQFTFRAPNQPGFYDFRLNDTDNNGREVFSIPFNVQP